MSRSEWTDADIATLRALYPHSTGKARSKLKHHTPQSIRSKASELGLTVKRKPWSTEEEAQLRAGLLPVGRGWPAAHGRAIKLEEQEGRTETHPWGNWHGNAGNRRGEWSESEKAALRDGRVPAGRSWQQAAMYIHWQKTSRGGI